MEIGAKDVGGAVVPANGVAVEILGRKGQGMLRPDGEYNATGGLAVIQISVKPWVDNFNPAPGPLADSQQALVGELEWGTGGQGGATTLDLQNGLIVAVAGSHAITLKAKLVEPTWDGVSQATYDRDFPPTIPGFAQRVEAVVLWKSSVSPKTPISTPKRFTLTGAAPSPFIRIPPFANSMILNLTDPAELGITVDFFWSDLAAGPVLAYQWDFTNLFNLTFPRNNVISSAVRFMRVNYTPSAPGKTQTITPVFELNL